MAGYVSDELGRDIVFGTGAVKISEMAWGGAILNMVGVLLITLFTVVVGRSPCTS